MSDERRNNDADIRERLAVLETHACDLRKHQDAMRVDIRAIRDTLAEAKGGWRVMMLIGGGAGVFGAFASTWLSKIIGVLPK